MEVKRYPVKEMGIWIRDLHEMYKQGTLKLNPEYQRSYVWEKLRDKRERLIDSLLRDFDIGKIFLREVKTLVGGTITTAYECLDGQQRLRSIFEFIEDKYATSKRITKEFDRPMTFSELEPRYQVKIRDLKITPIVVESDDDQMISDIFMRLQEGVPLRGPEKLNAERGFMRNTVVELSRNKLFQRTSIDPFRFAYRYLAAQIMHLEMEDVLDALIESSAFVNVGYKELLTMYRSYSDRDQDKTERVANRIKSNLNFLTEVLDKDASILWSKGDLICTYLLASQLRNRYVVAGNQSKLRDFLIQFLQKAAVSSVDAYGVERRSTTSGRTVKKMFDSMLGRLLETVPDLMLKDDKRLFDWGQKLAIYSRQNGKCKRCGRNVHLKESAFHHVKPYEEGGRTTVENGEMYHTECHPR